jgi:hypothetical protein
MYCTVLYCTRRLPGAVCLDATVAADQHSTAAAAASQRAVLVDQRWNGSRRAGQSIDVGLARAQRSSSSWHGHGRASERATWASEASVARLFC